MTLRTKREEVGPEKETSTSTVEEQTNRTRKHQDLNLDQKRRKSQTEEERHIPLRGSPVRLNLLACLFLSFARVFL